MHSPGEARHSSDSSHRFSGGSSLRLCENRGGLVLQERAGETHLLAVAFDVTVVSERGEAELTVVIGD